MKHGVKPTRAQKIQLREWKLDPADWLVIKDTSTEMHLVHRYSDMTRRVIQKGDQHGNNFC